jgi:type I restriction enzyme S subunit
LNQHIFKVNNYLLDKTFFYYALRSVTTHVEEQTHGIIGLVHITKPEIGTIRIPVPPTQEQLCIASYLDQTLKESNSLINHAQREIALINEYRTRLIADVVTGKRDVRHLAPSDPIPEAEDLEEPIADEDPLADDAIEPHEEAVDDDD